MSIVISTSVGVVYGLFTFGYMGSNRLKYCLANQIDYHPMNYVNQEEMVAALQQPGVENVSKSFDMIIRFGFISQLIFICF